MVETKNPQRHLRTLLALVFACMSTATMADVLDKPAVMSARASSLVQLSVTRAGNRLVTAGERGTILLSDDNGQSWRQAGVPVSVALTRVRFVDDKNGWAVGHSGVVLATRDGGETWNKQLDGKAAAQIELAAAQSEAGNESRRTTDAQRLVQDGPDKPFLDVHFSDAQHGIVVGAYGMAFRTEDGGRTWTSIMGKLAAGNGRHLYAILVAGDTLYLFGEQGTVLASGDKGNTFSRVEFPGKGTLFGALSTGDAIVAYGLKGNVFRSNDGRNWDKVELPPVSMTAGTGLGKNGMLLADEAGQLYRSDDGGRHFKPVSRTLPMTDLAQAADGALLGSSVRGMVRLDNNSNNSDNKEGRK
jgi:photosystem II stability/assembly factor-like uncharacterized protein